MVDFNGTKYTYLHNLQGDIVGILDSSGNLVVQYRYDAWGKLLATSTLTTAYTTLANLNPLRYRGYVYDTETGLYYLRSRYYKPEWGRFINADILLGKTGGLLSHNEYAYCENKPIVYADIFGLSKVYILYDARPNTTGDDKGGFGIQAEYIGNLFETQGAQVTKLGYLNMGNTEDGFITKWNSMDDEMDMLVIVGHGARASIDCNGTSLSITGKNRFCDLKKIQVNACVALYTCNGATPNKDGISAAELISERTSNAPVQALYYAKTYWLFNKHLITKYDWKKRKEDRIPWYDFSTWTFVRHHD